MLDYKYLLATSLVSMVLPCRKVKPITKKCISTVGFHRAFIFRRQIEFNLLQRANLRQATKKASFSASWPFGLPNI